MNKRIKKNLIFVFLIIISTFDIFNGMVHLNTFEYKNNYMMILGLDSTSFKEVKYYIYYTFINVLIIYYILKNIFSDMYESCDFLLTRLNKKKWILKYLINIFSKVNNTNILITILYLGYSCIYNIKVDYMSMIIIFLATTLLRNIIVMLLFLITVIFNKFNIIFYIFLAIIPFIMYELKVDILKYFFINNYLNLNGIVFLIIFNIVISIFFYNIFKKKLIKIFEMR